MCKGAKMFFISIMKMMKLFSNIHPTVSLTCGNFNFAVLLFDVVVAHTYFPKSNICLYFAFRICILHYVHIVILNTEYSEYRRQQEAEFAFNVCNYYPNIVSKCSELIANVNIERPNEERK